MKKVLCFLLALTLVMSAATAMASTQIDGLNPRNITINTAGLNDDAETCYEKGYSPTTGRKLSEIVIPDGFLGFAATGDYTPFMVQITNADNGIGLTSAGKLYRNAPINGIYADIVYEAPQKSTGGETRMSMIFSDTIPDFVGFVRSTRATHPRIRQEWNALFCTSGYSDADVPDEWRALGVKNPGSSERSKEDPGVAYVGDYSSKPWATSVLRIFSKRGARYSSANTEVFNLTKILLEVAPKDYVAYNHTFLFSDELPEGGDSGNIVYVKFGDVHNTDSRLEYSEADKCYFRYVKTDKSGDLPYCNNVLVNPEVKKVQGEGANVAGQGLVIDEMVAGDPIGFSNVIVQSVAFNWLGTLRPDPKLVGTGNADYFMGGKHYQGVWERKDYDSRTVFYDENGNELQLQRGRTLIILMNYNSNHTSVSYE
jgi:hypothetical protein